jgi:hypothetical protein
MLPRRLSGTRAARGTRGASLLGVLVLACHGATAPGVPPAPSALSAPALDTACVVSAGTVPRPPDSIVVALTEPVDPVHAPVPRNDAERLVFAQLYETLVEIDCGGRVRPGLADSWTSADGGRRWTFTLRQDARFWDGAPVTARDVLAAWLAQDSALLRFAWLPRAVSAPSERVLSVLLPEPDTGAARLFAAPPLAVHKRAPDGRWPVGSAARWVTGETASARHITAAPVPGHELPTLSFLVVAGGDARDALDAGADLLVTTDPAALEYAATSPELVVVPLAWDRTYVLLASAAGGPAGADLEDLRHAVHVDARPAERFYWWWRLTGCDVPAAAPAAASDTSGTPTGRGGRIVYDHTDRVARDLADRLVARALVGRGTVAAGLAPEALAASLRSAGDRGYVVRLDRRAPDRCRQVQEFLAGDASGRTAVVPLLDTRAHAILRRGCPRLVVDWYGTLRLLPR